MGHAELTPEQEAYRRRLAADCQLLDPTDEHRYSCWSSIAKLERRFAALQASTEDDRLAIA